MPEPLPPPPLPADDPPPPSTASKVVPWVVFGLCLLVMLAIASCVDRCSRTVDKVLYELGKYSTDIGPGWERKPIIEVDALLTALAEDEDATKARYVGEPIVVRGPLLRREVIDEDSALLTLGSDKGRVQTMLWLGTARARAAFAAITEGDTVVVGGYVDWMNRGTVALRSGELQAQWVRGN